MPLRRLFVAVYPPLDVAARLLNLLASVTAKHRPMNAAQLHMTLVFLGDTPASNMPRVAESVERAAAGIPAFDVAPTRLIALPSARQARLVAVQTTAPSPLLELQRRLAARLVTPKAGSHAFRPHITLARFPGVASCELQTDVPDIAFEVNRVRLIQTRLQPGGAVHVVWADVALPPH